MMITLAKPCVAGTVPYQTCILVCFAADACKALELPLKLTDDICHSMEAQFNGCIEQMLT